MPAPRKLSDTFIAEHKAAPKGKRIETSDTISRLRLRITNKGKAFYYVARFPGSDRPARRHVGDYPGLSLAEARKKARQWDELLERGIDPRKELLRERAAAEAVRKAEAMACENVFEARAREYLRTHCKDHRQASETIRIVDKELVPVWRGERVDQITSRDIKALILEITERSPSMARNVLTVIKSFFSWAFEREYVEDNPAAAIRPKTLIGEKKPRQRILSDDEIVAFWRATEQLGQPYRQFYRFLLLTGVRLREAGNARWSEIKGDVWTIPPERFKSDSYHTVPLSGLAMQLLDELPKGGEFIFSCDGGRHPLNSFSKPKERLDAIMGASDWVAHDLRRVVRSKLASLKVPDTIAEMVIGHGKRGLQRVYDQHQYLDELRDALERWAGKLRDLTTPHDPKKVVKFRGRR